MSEYAHFTCAMNRQKLYPDQLPGRAEDPAW